MYRSFLSKDQIPPKDQAVRIWAYSQVVKTHLAVVGYEDGEFEKDYSTRALKFLRDNPLKFWSAEFWEKRQRKEPDRSFWDFIPMYYSPLFWYNRWRDRLKPNEIREVSGKEGTGVQLAEVLLSKKQARSRLITALASGAALIAPMLIMVLHATVLTRILTTCIFTAAAALVLAFFMKDSSPNDIAGATAAYAAVLIVFIGAGFSTVN